MKAGAELPLAKLNFNLANTLRVHRRRIQSRRHGGGAHAIPARRAGISAHQSRRCALSRLSLLQSLELAIRALGMYRTRRQKRKHGQELLERLEKADPAKPGCRTRSRAKWPRCRRRWRDIHDLDSFVRQVAPSNFSRQRIEEQLQTLHEGRTVEDHAEFDQIRAMLDQAIASGEVTGERADSFRSMLQQYQNLQAGRQRRRSNSPRKPVEMHEHTSAASRVSTPPPRSRCRGRSVSLNSLAACEPSSSTANRASSDSDREFQFMLEQATPAVRWPTRQAWKPCARLNTIACGPW